MERVARLGFVISGFFVLVACTAGGRRLGEAARAPRSTVPRLEAPPAAPGPRPVSTASQVDAGAAAPEAPPPGPRSPPLRNAALRSPMPGGRMSGYAGDTGLDIGGDHLPVFAIASGTVDYAERGHTRWTRGRDTPLTVRITLDAPIPFEGRRVTHVWYTHLAELAFEQPSSTARAARRHVEAGERLGVSGVGNGVPHLHLGLLLDDQVEQDDWTFILREHQVRKVLGGYDNGVVLPVLPR